jgi:hypothetical protein
MENKWDGGHRDQYTDIAHENSDWTGTPGLAITNDNWDETRLYRRNDSWRYDGSLLSRPRIGSINSFESDDRQTIPEILRVGRNDSWGTGRQSNGRKDHWEASRNAYGNFRKGGNGEREVQYNQLENERNWKIEHDQEENERRWEIERQHEENDLRWEAECRREENERNWEIEQKREQDERKNHSTLKRERSDSPVSITKDGNKPLPRIPSWEDDRQSRRRDSSGSIDINEDIPRPLRISRGATLQEGDPKDHNSPLVLRGGGTDSQHSGSIDLDTLSIVESEGLENSLHTRRTSSTARRLVLTFRPQRAPRTEPTTPPSNFIPVSPLSTTQVGIERSLANSIDLNSQLSVMSIIKYHDKDVQCDFDEEPKKKKRQAAADGSLPTGSRLAILLVCTCMAIFLQALVSN